MEESANGTGRLSVPLIKMLNKQQKLLSPVASRGFQRGHYIPDLSGLPSPGSEPSGCTGHFDLILWTWTQERQPRRFPKPATSGCLSVRRLSSCPRWALPRKGAAGHLQTSPRGFICEPSQDLGFFFFFFLLLYFSQGWELGRPSLAQLAAAIRHQKENNPCALNCMVS